MASFNVNHEKANAMRMFHTKRNLETAFHLFNVSAALFLFSRSSFFPLALRAFRHSYAAFLPLFNDPLYAFLLLNAIILSLYAFSNNNNNNSLHPNHLRDEFLANRKITAAARAPAAAKVQEKVIAKEKRTVTRVDATRSSSEAVGDQSPVPNGTATSADRVETTRLGSEEVGDQSPVSNGTVTAVTRKETTRTRSTSASGEKASKIKRCYERSLSENSCKQRVEARGPEMRRANTTGSGRSREEEKEELCHVAQLGEEEFNRTIEEFIARQKRMLREEQMEDKTEHLGKTEFNRTVESFIANQRRMLWEEQMQTKTEYLAFSS